MLTLAYKRLPVDSPPQIYAAIGSGRESFHQDVKLCSEEIACKLFEFDVGED
ncbi:hypothetical protein EASAB2608_02867 [Streptomyces sp. EAS-AB2608]|nr:hypothetical protein EASAB2608_02867 [Streptomyces sp. EAS-AB2608]CUW29639.1 hypothetical protein TUE45_04348 [Streptomyces reticuli]